MDMKKFIYRMTFLYVFIFCTLLAGGCFSFGGGGGGGAVGISTADPDAELKAKFPGIAQATLESYKAKTGLSVAEAPARINPLTGAPLPSASSRPFTASLPGVSVASVKTSTLAGSAALKGRISARIVASGGGYSGGSEFDGALNGDSFGFGQTMVFTVSRVKEHKNSAYTTLGWEIYPVNRHGDPLRTGQIPAPQLGQSAQVAVALDAAFTPAQLTARYGVGYQSKFRVQVFPVEKPQQQAAKGDFDVTVKDSDVPGADPEPTPPPEPEPDPIPAPLPEPIPLPAGVQFLVFDEATTLALGGVTVALSSGQNGVTAADGSISFTLENEGTYAADFSRDQYDPLNYSFLAKAGESLSYVIHLKPVVVPEPEPEPEPEPVVQGSFSLYVNNFADNSPISGASVVLSNGLTGSTDGTGVVVFPISADAVVSISVSHADFLSRSVDGIQVSGSQSLGSQVDLNPRVIRSTISSTGEFSAFYPAAYEASADGTHAETSVETSLVIDYSLLSFARAEMAYTAYYFDPYSDGSGISYLSNTQMVAPTDTAHNKGDYWIGFDAIGGSVVENFTANKNGVRRVADVTQILKTKPSNLYFTAFLNQNYYNMKITEIQITIYYE